MMRLFVLISLLSLVAACGGGNGTGTTTASNPLTAKTSAQLVSMLDSQVLSSFPKSNAKPTTPLAGTGLAALKNSGLSCVTQSPTTPVDLDSDSIFANRVTTYNCNEADAGSGNIVTYLGSFTETDKDDDLAGIMGGYRFDFNVPTLNTSFTYTMNSENYKLVTGGSYNGYWEGSGTSTSSTFVSDFSGKNVYAFDNLTTSKNYSGNYDYMYTMNMTITHDAVAVGQPWNTGTLNGSGTYQWTSNFSGENPEPAGEGSEQMNGSYHLNWKTIDLIFDHTCSVWYKSGSYEITDTAGNVIQVTYQCSTKTVTFNGAAVTATQ
jgi:hypothetical protein